MKRRLIVESLLGYAFAAVFLIILGAALVGAYKVYPNETLLLGAILAVCATAVMLYVGELTVLCGIVDFLDSIAMPNSTAGPIPLEYEEVGEIIVVTFRDNIVTLKQCLAVQRQLQELIAWERCDFVLDFQCAGKISRSFRGVLINLRKAARREAERLGRFDPPTTPRRRVAFRVFRDRKSAMEVMSKTGGHGWVVLCGLPVGIRAVAGLT